ncbi:plasmid stabilization protein [Achromatium sp. WMS3]|nr:plasmid stabilization protein [Achromatium sp. WMS3]
MNGIAFDQDARNEFLAAIEYYEVCRAGLGQQFRMAVEKQLKNIENMPFLFRVLHKSFRRCLVPKFPYAIIFTIEPYGILIIAVVHVKRDPNYWHKRITKCQ